MSIFVKTFRIEKRCPGDQVVRFKNDYGGYDLVLFKGNARSEFQNEVVDTIERIVENYGTARDGGKETILRLRSGYSMEVSRYFSTDEKEGYNQLFSSRLVQLLIDNNWYDVRISPKRWDEKARENIIFVVAEITLPERLTDEQ
jgi:hypothetical protein